jgi:hybrid polyketide synthase/nonribosomal peptide synthetase ACE1
MVLNDVTLENMTYDQMMRVLRPKVDGSRHLDRIFHSDPLDFFVLLSSLSCVLGRKGQSNYDAANMYLVGLAATRRARGVAASVVDIGAIMGTGYMAREVSDATLAQLFYEGYWKMSERDFHIAFANAVMVGQAGSGESEELITGLRAPLPGAPFQPGWVTNARFGHVLQRSGGAVDRAAVTAQSETTRERLKRAKTPGDAGRVLEGEFETCAFLENQHH